MRLDMAYSLYMARHFLRRVFNLDKQVYHSRKSFYCIRKTMESKKKIPRSRLARPNSPSHFSFHSFRFSLAG